jgi:hypothetical protein
VSGSEGRETKIDKIVRHVGVAGQYSLEAWVTYWHGPNPADADATITTFVSSVYGAPVVMVMSNGQQVPADDWRRYGERLDASWVKAFYGVSA